MPRLDGMSTWANLLTVALIAESNCSGLGLVGDPLDRAVLYVQTVRFGACGSTGRYVQSGTMQSERFEMRASLDLLGRIDEWRRRQADLPNRSEAIRRLIERGLAAPADRIPIRGAGPAGAPDGGSAGDDSKLDAGKKAAPAKPAASATPASKEAQLRALRENRP